MCPMNSVLYPWLVYVENLWPYGTFAHKVHPAWRFPIACFFFREKTFRLPLHSPNACQSTSQRRAVLLNVSGLSATMRAGWPYTATSCFIIARLPCISTEQLCKRIELVSSVTYYSYYISPFATRILSLFDWLITMAPQILWTRHVHWTALTTVSNWPHNLLHTNRSTAFPFLACDFT